MPVVDVDTAEEAPGGAGNTAANLAALGARVRLVGVVGDDRRGGRLARLLAERGVTAELVTAPGRRTTLKRRLLAGGQLVARYDEEDHAPLPDAVEREVLDRLARVLPGADVVVACDYSAGVCTGAVRRTLARHRPLVVDAHAVAPWREAAPTVVLPNYAEALRLLGEERDGRGNADRVGFLLSRSARLLETTAADMVITTLDGDGTLLHRRGREPYRTYAEPVPDHLTAGAGDSYTAAFALWLAEGAAPEEAARAGQAAAAVVVRRPGTATCSHEEVVRRMRPRDGVVQEPERLAQRLDEYRRRGRRIVFTNGCFDVLHRGHVFYLEQARELGDVLVVAVNSDASVARLKGAGRPINPCRDRMSVLAALTPVDYVTCFEEDTPARLLRMFRPHLYVKGGDYTPEMLPETPLVRALGGEVRVLGYLPDHSTTAVIERARTADGRARPAAARRRGRTGPGMPA